MRHLTLGLFFYLLLQSPIWSQNQNGLIDVAGDIAIVAFHDAPDGYSFILLDDCPDGVSIQFTDKEWTGAAFEAGEGGSLWTNNTGGVIAAGTVIDIQNADAGGTASLGTVSENDSGFTLGTTGEQLYAVTGTLAAPGTFLAFAGGLNGNSTATLAGTGLVDGQTAVVFADNEGYYMGSTSCNGSITDCAAMINTVANWSLGGFTFPTDVPDLFNGSALPVELIYFSALSQQNEVFLSWATASEYNNAGFEIERSLDGRNFTNIAWVEGQGDSNHRVEYTFKDNQLEKGHTYYYRLKQMDYNGVSSYSEIRSTSLYSDITTIGEFAPNPIHAGNSQIQLFSNTDSSWTVRIFNSSGSLINQSEHLLVTGFNQLNIDFSAYNAGLYFVQIENNTTYFQKKVIVQN